eukprot:7359725-Prymnesium_polylepis.1
MLAPFLPAEAAVRGASQPAVGLLFAAMPVAASCGALLAPSLLARIDSTRLLRVAVCAHGLLALAFTAAMTIRDPFLFCALATAVRIGHGVALAVLELTLHSSARRPALHHT